MLAYPCGELPAPGVAREIARGVHWIRMPLRWALNHINVWLLDDEDAFGPGVAIVDTGMADDALRGHWDSILNGRRVTRVIVTHQHPDHVGLAGWLCERHAVRLMMSRTEYMAAKLIKAEASLDWAGQYRSYIRRAGWSQAEIAAFDAARPWRLIAGLADPLPTTFDVLRAEDVLKIGHRQWRVVVGRGHVPEHICLVDANGELLIAGDQVLPRISSNISVPFMEQESDPLSDWLGSIEQFRKLPASALVLPAHGEPFLGLHQRLDELMRGHHESLDRLLEFCTSPRRIIDCFAVLFPREIGAELRMAATGEAFAHLRWLERKDRIRREERDQVLWFQRCG